MEVLLDLFISPLSLTHTRRCCISISPRYVPQVPEVQVLTRRGCTGSTTPWWSTSTFIQAGAVSGDGPSIDCIE